MENKSRRPLVVTVTNANGPGLFSATVDRLQRNGWDVIHLEPRKGGIALSVPLDTPPLLKEGRLMRPPHSTEGGTSPGGKEDLDLPRYVSNVVWIVNATIFEPREEKQQIEGFRRLMEQSALCEQLLCRPPQSDEPPPRLTLVRYGRLTDPERAATSPQQGWKEVLARYGEVMEAQFRFLLFPNGVVEHDSIIVSPERDMFSWERKYDQTVWLIESRERLADLVSQIEGSLLLTSRS